MKINFLPPDDPFDFAIDTLLWVSVPVASTAWLQITQPFWQSHSWVFALLGAAVVAALIAWARHLSRPAVILLVFRFFQLGIGTALGVWRWTTN